MTKPVATDVSTEVSTASSELDEEEEQEQEVAKGVVIASRTSDALLALDLLNPETGEVSRWKTFPEVVDVTLDGDVLKSLSLPQKLENVAKAYRSQFWSEKAFHGDFSKLAVVFKRRGEDSERVGILDEYGNLVDVSKLLVGEEDSFSSARNFWHRDPYFDGDYFYFTDIGLNDKVTLFQIPVDNLTSSAIQEVDVSDLEIRNEYDYVSGIKEYLDDEKTYFYLRGRDGSIVDGDSDSIYLHEDVVGLLAEKTFLTTSFAIRKTLKEPLGNKTSDYEAHGLYVDDQDNQVGLLLPENARENYNPVISPDGTSVIFLSRFNDKVSIFQVPSVGGEPVEVVNNFNSYNYGYAFISWIE